MVKETIRGTLGTGQNEWYTPAGYLQRARSVLGRIDLDPASCNIANNTVRASVYYDQEMNGLSLPWYGNVWLNPPYSQPLISQFVDKAAEEWESGSLTGMIILTHNYTDTKWFSKLIAHASAVCFTRGRVRFESPEGKRASPTQGQVFFYFGPETKRFTRVFSAIGNVMRPERVVSDLFAPLDTTSET